MADPLPHAHGIYDCPICGAGQSFIDLLSVEPHDERYTREEYLCRGCQHALSLLNPIRR